MKQEELDKIVEQHQHWIEEFRFGKVLDEPLTGYKKTLEGVLQGA